MLFGSAAWAMTWLSLRSARSARGRHWLLRRCCCCCTGGLGVDVVGVVAFGEECSLQALVAQAEQRLHGTVVVSTVVALLALLFGEECSRPALAAQAGQRLHSGGQYRG